MILDSSSPAPATPPVKEVSPEESTMLGLAFAWELGYTISLPAIAFGLGGAYLDKYLGTSHWFLFLGMGFAFTISFINIFRKLRVIIRRLPKDLPKKKKLPVDPETVREQELLHDLFRPPHE